MGKTFTPIVFHHRYGWKTKVCWLAPLLLLCAVAFAQAQTVTGKITDSDGNNPLPGASIVVKGSSVGTTTDANGEYSIAVEDLNTILVFSFIGYESQEIQVGGRTRIDVVLKPDIQSLEEVVVVGYGTQRKRDVTGAIA